MKLPTATGLPLVCALLMLAPIDMSVFAAEPIKVMIADSIEFKADANVPGVATALIAGNPKLGPTYTVRARISPNTRLPAHFHPDQRVVTVISGTYYFGSGEEFDEATITAYGPGTVVVVPAGAPHFAAAKEDGAVVQESGDGPTGVTVIEKK